MVNDTGPLRDGRAETIQERKETSDLRYYETNSSSCVSILCIMNTNTSLPELDLGGNTLVVVTMQTPSPSDVEPMLK
jgi:hypothetical protein